MDLSVFKWPVIILVIIAIGWLFTSGGVSWMEKIFTAATPGVDAKQDEVDEAGLTKLGGYMFMTFRYGRAEEILQKAVDRYPQGKNVYYNWYRLVKCREIDEKYEEAVDILVWLMDNNAHENDERVPENDNLKLRANKIIETNDLGELIP